ncbi:MAG: hypothetical protein JWP63_1001 [Candidatus Solibacter sp.]|jgi:hypothetical protein|nr:hypothetical protein [Candidatus Solibacter sp.]
MRDERLGIFTGLTRYVQMRSFFVLLLAQLLFFGPTLPRVSGLFFY